MGAFDRGFQLGTAAYDSARAEERAKEELAMRKAAEARAAEEFDWRRNDRSAEEAAINTVRAYQGGVYDGSQADFSQLPPMSDAGPTQPPAGGLRVPGPGGTPLPSRQASPLEMNRALQGVALARKDMNAFSALEKDNRVESLKAARQAEFKRLQGMKDQELVGLFQDSINANPDVPAMVDFDPKSKKYVLVSQVPGFPTQMLSRAEMMQAAMGAWEAGNGDYSAGIQALVSGATAQRDIQDKNFTRSSNMAKANADLYFADRRDQRDAARLGIAQSRAAQEDWAVIGATEDDKGLLRFNRRTGKTEVQPLPNGTSASGLFRKLTGAAADPEMTKLPEDGTRVRDRSGNVLTYTEGQPLLPGGVAPSGRPKAFQALGLPAQAEALVSWAPGGRHLQTPDGMYYDTANPDDMRELRARVEAGSRGLVTSAEVEAGGMGYRPRNPGGPLTAANEFALRRMEQSLPRRLGNQR